MSTAETLFIAHQPAVLRYLTRVVGQADTARDLTQEVFLRVSRSSIPAAGVGELRGLTYVDGFVDPRKKKFAERDVYDYMDFYVKWSSPKNLVVMRDMPQTIAKVRDMLWATNIKFTEVETKSAYGTVAKVEFTIPAAVTVSPDSSERPASVGVHSTSRTRAC